MSNSTSDSTRHPGRSIVQDPRARSLARCSSAEARALVPYDLAKQLEVLPVGVIVTKDGKSLVVACVKSRIPEVRSALRFSTGLKIKAVEVGEEELHAAQFVAYCGDTAMLESHLAALRAAEMVTPPPPLIKHAHSESEIPVFVRALLRYSYAQRASDVHLTPTPRGTCLSIRVDGEMLDRSDPIASFAQHEHLVRHIKVLSSLDVTNRFRPQDGVLRSGLVLGNANLATEVPFGQVRVSCMPTQHGERIVLRLASSSLIPSLDALGLPAGVLAHLREMLGGNEGAVLFCGSTGSGKSTTLYSIVRELVARGQVVSSIEDPVEVTIDGVSQTSLNELQGLDYEAGLRGALRQDPDAIMLGELRTAQSASMAIHAAMSGHLVLSTVHAASVFHVLPRLRMLGIQDDLSFQAVRLIVHQRLVPKICAACRVIDLQGSQRVGFEIVRSVGCSVCSYRGFSGRVLIAELLVFDRLVQAFLAEKLPISEIQERVTESGHYISGREQVQQFARGGIIAGSELERVE